MIGGGTVPAAIRANPSRRGVGVGVGSGEAFIELARGVALAVALVEIADHLDDAPGRLRLRRDQLREGLRGHLGAAEIVGDETEMELAQRVEPRLAAHFLQGLKRLIRMVAPGLDPGTQQRQGEALRPLARQGLNARRGCVEIAGLDVGDDQHERGKAGIAVGRDDPAGQRHRLVDPALGDAQREGAAHQIEIAGIVLERLFHHPGGVGVVVHLLRVPGGEIVAERARRRGSGRRAGRSSRRIVRALRRIDGTRRHGRQEGGRCGKAPRL